jgi:hypothetical protein
MLGAGSTLGNLICRYCPDEFIGQVKSRACSPWPERPRIGGLGTTKMLASILIATSAILYANRADNGDRKRDFNG